MTPASGPGAEKSLGEIVEEVSEKASLLVREEIELAKAEVTAKAKTLAKGAGVAAAAGVFLIFAVVMLLQTLAWFINDLIDTQVVWPGFLIVTLLLIALGAGAGVLAKRWLSTGAPTPDLAIEEAKITRQAFEQQGVERDQLDRSLERSEKQDETA
ncbi:MAG: phage holin family protein [Thermoleophilaceae bacterium]|nr:phage holin family protein [Thermoleophilaceae bacterium]